MKITIEINDVLPDKVEGLIDQFKEWATDWFKDNPGEDYAAFERAHEDLCDSIHEWVDSAVPVYTSDIKAAWFLHGNELEEAYEQSGIGNNPMENNGMTAIYCYLEQELNAWIYDNIENIYEEAHRFIAVPEDEE